MFFFEKEDISLDKNDLDRPLTKYQNYEIKGIFIDILIGNKNILLDKNICYYNIYTADSKQRIGVFEFPLDELSSHVDEQGDVIPSETPKLFSFVNIPFLQSAKKIQQKNHQELLLKKALQTNSIKSTKYITSIEKSKTNKEKYEKENHEKENHEKEDNCFKKKKKKDLYDCVSASSNSKLPIETQKDAKTAIQEYKKWTKGEHMDIHWLNATMKNIHYTVQPESSFWSILEKAMEKVGKKTSKEKCVSYLANHSSLELLFHEDKVMYSELEMLKYEQDRRAFTITSRLNDIAKLFKSSSPYVLSKEDLQRLKEEKSQLEKELQYIEQDLKDLNDDIETKFSYMKHVKTLNDYKEFIQSSYFKVNEWAIQMMEHAFNIKCIWFSKIEQKDAKSKVFTLPLLPSQKSMRPDMYLLLGIETLNPDSDQNVFDNILWIFYKNHGVFSFQELPFSVKCLASQGIMTTPFRNLPDFQVLTGFRIIPRINQEENLEYQTQTRFPIYSKSVPPIIPSKKWVYFRKLRKIKEWYKILSDDYMIQGGLSIDNHLWPSVTHYVLAGHFVDHSVYYLEFTMDGGYDSVISKSAEIAREAANHTGVYRLKNPKKGSLNLSNIKYIPNNSMLKQTNVDWVSRRVKALRVKFEDNERRRVLLMTLDAVLLDEKGEEDNLLMQVRQELRVVKETLCA